MNEDLYNKIDRYNNGEMEAEEAASFRQQLYDDQEFAEEVRLNQRIDEEFSDAKKLALRETLGALSETYVPVPAKRVNFRHWMPVIFSTAAAAVALYFFVNRSSIESQFSGTGFFEGPVPYDSIVWFETDQNSLRRRLIHAPENSTMEELLSQPITDISIKIIQPPQRNFIIAPKPEVETFSFMGEINQVVIERYGQPIIKWFNSEKLLEQKSVVLNDTESTKSADSQSFYFNVKLPTEQGWHYYQILSQDGETVLYIGKLGVRR